MKRIAFALLSILVTAALTHPAPSRTGAAKNRVLECLNSDYPIEIAPAIKIEVSGFLLIRFNGCNRPCEIGVPREIGRHVLNIYIVRLQRGGKPEIIYNYWGPLKDALWLGVFKPKYPGIHRFGVNNFEAVKADKRDFGWAVDLESPEYHNTPLQWNAASLAPSIYITNGVFYSEGVPDASQTSITRKTPSGRMEANYRMVATKISGNIDFDASAGADSMAGFAALRFAQESQPVAKLDFDPSGAVRYEIHIENDPLDPVHVHESDFKDYYRFLKPLFRGTPYDFDFSIRATDRLPCMPAVFGGQ